MRNILIFLAFTTIFVMAVIREPIADTIDALAGSTNPTYTTTIDSIAGVSKVEDD